MKKNKITSLIILVIFIILATVTLIFSKSHKQTNPISKTSFCFDTVITITIYDKAKETLLDDCLNLCDYYNNLFDCHLEGSDIYKINHSNGLPVTVSSKTIDLLNYACNYANLSNGSVDPTIGSVSSLWDFTTDDFSLPASSDISNAIIHVNYENIIIDNDQVYLKDPASSIDLGFIAKGYVADQLKSHLLSNGVQSGIINLGHNILLIGAKPDGSDFQIGIQNPDAQEGVSLKTLSLKDCSIVTSGNYERYFIIDGVRYHHILSTETGYPVNSDLASVTILSKNSVDGDALSTLLFTLGLEKGMEYISSIPNVDAVFVTTEGKVISVGNSFIE